MNLHLTPDMPYICLSFVLFTIFIIVVTQKLILQQFKNVTAKCTENLSPPPWILYLLGNKVAELHKSKYIQFLKKIIAVIFNGGGGGALISFNFYNCVLCYVYCILGLLTAVPLYCLCTVRNMTIVMKDDLKVVFDLWNNLRHFFVDFIIEVKF